MIRRPPRSTLDRSSAASDVYKRQVLVWGYVWGIVGMLLSVPLTAIIKIIISNSNSPNMEFFEQLMSQGKE